MEGEIIVDQLNRVEVIKGRDVSRFLVKEGDVVLLARGNSMRAAYVTEEVSKLNVILSANFILLRPNSDQLRGEVLVSYFNSEQGQNTLSATSVGAAIRNISLSNIRRLQVEIPSLEKQQEIADIFHVSNEVYKSTLLMAEQQQKVANACIHQLMKGAA
jgi:restriction endonuclease S subunit